MCSKRIFHVVLIQYYINLIIIVITQAGVGDGEYLAAFRELIIPMASEFQPQLTFVSAGFDSGAGDPLVSLY